MYKKYVLLVFLLTACMAFAGPNKPQIKIASDRFPTGQETPEGVASDFARVFIGNDSLLLQRIVLRPYGGGRSRAEYVHFISGMSANLDQGKKAGTIDPKNPNKIVTVFAARHFSKDGPNSYGSAAFGFQDVVFVDVEVALNGGGHYTDRTLVIKDKDGKWYVHPAPYISPLLSSGLDGEGASEQTFEQVYDVR